MRQVLFRIPLDGVLQIGPLSLPWFGIGILLVLWLAFGIAGFIVRRRASQGKWESDDLHAGITWAVIAGLIVAAPEIQRRLGFSGLPIFGYGTMLFIGFVSAVMLASHRAKQQGFSPDVIWDLAPWLLIPGVLVRRIFYCIEYRQEVFFDCRNAAEYLWSFVNLSKGGLVFYGSVFGGAAGFFAFCRHEKLNALRLADVITPSIFVGIGFGRIGCLLNGCCYGDFCSLPWAIHFPHGSVTFQALVQKGLLAPDAAMTPGLHPTQIYSALDGFLIAWLTAMYFPYRHRNGEVLGVGLMVYATSRFLIEILRADEPAQFGTSLTISQQISLGMFLVGFALIFGQVCLSAWRQVANGLWDDPQKKNPG